VTGNILQTAYLSVYDFFQALYGILAMSVLVFLLYMQVPLHFEVLFIVRYLFIFLNLIIKIVEIIIVKLGGQVISL
jgi:hypothetical protein